MLNFRIWTGSAYTGSCTNSTVYDVKLQWLGLCAQAAKHLVILTGAGVSAESGVPTFR